MANFEQAIKTVLEHEGGYSHDSSDPGGETKYGISKRSYPDLNIAALTAQDAIVLYKRDFWCKYGYEHIGDDLLATKIFDLSVNMGPNQAHRLLQRALKAYGSPVTEDGKLGPVTINAVNSAQPLVLRIALKSEAAGYYRTLSATKTQLAKFLPGWLNRAYS